MNDPTAPNSTADPPVSANDGRWLQVSRVLGLIVSIAVVAAALGRQFGLPFLQGPATGWDAMRANGTLGLLLSGLALALAARPEGVRAARYSVTGLAIAVIGFGVQRAADIFLRWSEAMLGVDGDSELSALLWRMSPMSAFGLLFAGIGLLIAARPMPARLRGTVAAAMGSAVLGISAMRVLGLGLSTWRGFPWWTIDLVSPFSTFAFVLIGVALLALARGLGALKRALSRRLTAMFLLGVVLLILAEGVAFNFADQLRLTDQEVNRSSIMLKEITEVMTGLARIETRQRTYIITGNELNIATREDDVKRLETDLAELTALTADDAAQRARLDTLSTLIDRRLQIGDETIVARREQGFAAAQARVASGLGGALSDQIYRRAQHILDHERVALSQHQRRSASTAVTTFLLLPIGVSLSLAMLSLGLFSLNTRSAEMQRAELAIRSSEAQLSNALRLAHLAPWTYDFSTDRFTFNDLFYALFRTTAEKQGGYSISVADFERRFIHPDDAGIVEAGTRRAIESTSPEANWEVEQRAVFGDGEIGHIAVRVCVVKDSAGRTVQSFGVVQDVTERRRAEDALKESEERLLFALQTTRTGAWELDLQGRATHHTPIHCQIFGYEATPPDWSYERFLEHVIPEDRMEVDRRVREARATESDWSFECRIRRVDGEIRWIFVAGGHGRNAKGKVTQLSGIVRDITERKQAEEKLRKSEDRFRSMLENARDAIAMHDLDGRFIGVNREMCEGLGYTRDEMLQMTINDIDTPEYAALVPVRIERLKQVGYQVFEAAHRRRDGTVIPVEISSQLIDEDGRKFVLSICRDLTERKRAEEALQERLRMEERFSKLAATAPGAMFTYRVRPDGTASMPYASPRFEEVLGVAPSAVAEDAAPAFARVHRDDLAGVLESVKTSILKRTPWNHVARVLHPQKGEVWIEGRSMPELAVEGGLVWHGFLIDITQRKRAELLAQGQRQVMELIAYGAALPETLAALLQTIESSIPDLFCSILLLDRDGLHLRHGAAPSLPEAYIRAIDGMEIGPSAGSCGTAAYRREAVWVDDIGTDPLWENFRALAMSHGFRACWSTPIIDAQGRVMATLAIYRREIGAPTAEHRYVIDLATHTASIAIGHHQTSAALHASEVRYRSLVETGFDIIWEVDEQMRYTFVSPRVTEVLGYPTEEVLGHSMFEFLPPDERVRLQQIAAKNNKTMESFEHLETVYLHRDGRRLTLESAGMPLFDQSGRFHGFRGSARDITERKRAELRVAQQLARVALLNQIVRAIGENSDLDSIFQIVTCNLEDHLPVDFSLIAVDDDESDILAVQAVGAHSEQIAAEAGVAERMRIPTEASTLAPCLQGTLIHEPDLTLLQTPLGRSLAKQGLGDVVFAPMAMKERVFGVIVAARRETYSFSSEDCEFLRQLGEHVALATYQIRLVHDLQRAYDGLRHTQDSALQQERLRALGQMASGIAHDINNAISPVSLYCDLLQQTETHLSAEAKDFLKTIQHSVQDVAGTVARLREFYRKREAQADLMPVSLNRLAGEVVKLTRARWVDMPQEQGIVIDMDLDLAPGLPDVPGIETEIREALINLVFNAVDAMPSGGKLTLRTGLTKNEPQRIFIEVSDSGIGMDDDTRRRCLEPFFTTKGERGTGLGLAMVCGVAQRHDAAIAIESELGAGSTVRLSFMPSNEAILKRTGGTTSTPTRKLKILIVDDDPLISKALGIGLKLDGHALEVANGGQEGVDLFVTAKEQGEPFEFVITDLGMPHIDGRQVAASIKTRSPQTPVVLLTGWGEQLRESGTIPEHIDRVLSKPPRLAEVRAAIAALGNLPGS